MNNLGRSSHDSDVRDTHLSLVLSYLHQHKTEKLKSTLSKLALVCGMAKRYLRENYIEGLIEFGIIDLKVESNDEVWNWVGLKVFEKENNSSKIKGVIT